MTALYLNNIFTQMTLSIGMVFALMPPTVQSFGSSTLPTQTPSGTLLNLENNKEKFLYSRDFYKESKMKNVD